MCDLAAQAAPQLSRYTANAWTDVMVREHDNLRAAFQWCIAAGHIEAGLDLVGNCATFGFGAASLPSASPRQQRKLAQAAADVPTTPRVRALPRVPG